jgi:hypothetical protein
MSVGRLYESVNLGSSEIKHHYTRSGSRIGVVAVEGVFLRIIPCD